MNRDQFQLDTANAAYRAERSYFEGATGIGKTRIGVLLAKKFSNVSVVVPTEYLQRQWQRELPTANVYIINTFAKVRPKQDLLIIDEGHMFLSEEAEIYNTCLSTSYSHCLVLSATLDATHKRHLSSNRFSSLGKITFEQALEYGWVSPVLEYNLLITLSTWEKSIYAKYDKSFNYWGSRFNFSIDAANRALKSEGRDQHTLNLKKEAMLYMNAIRNRKDFINNHFSKEYAVKQILRHVTKPTAVFVYSIEQAEKLSTDEDLATKRIVLYHSKQSKKERLEATQKLETGEFDIVFCVKALNAGVDIPSLNNGIILAGGAVAREQIQRKGRPARLREGKQAIVVNILLNETQDLVWSRKRTTGTVRTIDSIEVIKDLL